MSIDSPPAASAPARLPSPAALLAWLALWLLATLGLRPLALPDEGRYVGVAREMLNADTLVPLLDGLPYFHKPPLFYWIDMAAMRVLGETEFAARIAPMLGAWLMGAALLLAMRRWHGPRAAAVTLGVLATTPYFFLGGQYANHDMLVAGLISAAVLALAHALEAPPRVDLRWLVAGWVLCALAVLAKGLIGIVLPALVIGPWLLAQGRWRQMLKLLHPLALLAFVVVVSPWFIAMQLRFPGFLDYFFVEQHFRRFAQSNFNNVRGFWYFLVALPLMTLPWSLWLPAAWRHAWANRNPSFGLYLWWTIAVVGFFSLPSSKLIGYALPALAPWCALLGLAVAEKRGRAWPWVMGVAALGGVAIVVAVALEAPKSSRPLAQALAARIAPTDTVVMVDAYYFDLPFYARLERPVVIAGRWEDPELPQRDNWRKELFDAARFDPAAGRAVLQALDRLAAIGCGAGAVWFVVPTPDVARVSGLSGAQREFGDAQAELWRVPAHACP